MHRYFRFSNVDCTGPRSSIRWNASPTCCDSVRSACTRYTRTILLFLITAKPSLRRRQPILLDSFLPYPPRPECRYRSGSGIPPRSLLAGQGSPWPSMRLLLSFPSRPRSSSLGRVCRETVGRGHWPDNVGSLYAGSQNLGSNGCLSAREARQLQVSE